MKRFFGALTIGCVGLLIGLMTLLPAHAKIGRKDKADAVGAWFGIARPCPANPITDSAEHTAFCTAACGLCPNSGVFPAEIPLIVTLYDDGRLLVDDAGEIGRAPGVTENYHTTAHGEWTASENDGLPFRRGTDRIKGSFLRFGDGPQFSNAVRQRFVTYFSSVDPDRMAGFLQPYFYPLAAGGVVVVNPPNTQDQLAGNHIPTIDPLAPLPAGCDLTQGCLGTFEFVIRRIKAQ